MANRSESHERFRANAEKLGLEIVPMVLVYGLADGARVKVTDATIVPMGDVFAHRQLTYTHDGDADRPGCRIVFEVRNSVPVCASINIWSDGESYVRAKDLKAIKLDNLRDDVYALTGVFVRNPDGDDFMHKLGPASFGRDRKRVERATQRRKITPEFLNRVAELHNTAPAGGRLEAIKAAFGVSERQALRYIAQARQKGLIDE